MERRKNLTYNYAKICKKIQVGGMNKTFHEALRLAINENIRVWRTEMIVPVFQIDLFIFELPQTLSPLWQ